MTTAELFTYLRACINNGVIFNDCIQTNTIYNQFKKLFKFSSNNKFDICKQYTSYVMIPIASLYNTLIPLITFCHFIWEDTIGIVYDLLAPLIPALGPVLVTSWVSWVEPLPYPCPWHLVGLYELNITLTTTKKTDRKISNVYFFLLHNFDVVSM